MSKLPLGMQSRLNCFAVNQLMHLSCENAPAKELNKARGPNVQVSRNRAHFYVYCTKKGTLWSFTNYWPFVDYDVQPHWLIGWWAAGKLDNEQCKLYLLKSKKSYRTLVQNVEAVAQAEQAECLEKYRMEVASILATARLPFRSFNDPSLGLFLAYGGC